MSHDSSATTAAAIAECRLDLDGLRDQRERYGALARQVSAIDLRDGTLEVRFGPGLDTRLLQQTLAVERECCPFFQLHYEPVARLLTASVENPEQQPALNAIAHALTP